MSDAYSAPDTTSGANSKPDGTALDDLFARLKKRVRDNHSDLTDWYKEAKEDFEFVAGHQWDDDTKKMLAEQMRPASTFNLIGAMVKAVSGYEVVNRQETRYIPRRLGTTGTAEVVSAAAKYFRDNTDAEDAESMGFRSATICGLGWLETIIEFEDNQDGEYVKRVIPVFEMIWDAKARDPNLADSKILARVRSMTCEEAEELFPDEDRADIDADWIDLDRDNKGNYHNDPADRYSEGEADAYADDRKVKVIDCQWWELETIMRMVDPMSGQMTTMKKADFDVLNKRMLSVGIGPLQGIPQSQRVYKRAFLGKKILGDVQPLPADKWFTYQAITGEYDETKGQFFGIVRPMKDPQRWTNKLFSQTMHILNTNATGGLMVEEGAFVDDRKAMMDWPKPNSVIKMTPGALAQGKVKEKPVTQINPAFQSLTEFAMSMGPRVTGINLEFLGMRQADQAGVLEHQRRQSAVTILATLFDALRLYRKREGRLTLRLIQKYLSDARLIRVVGEEGQMFLPLNRDATLGEYEVIVDDAPSSPNQKEMNWATITQLMPMLGKILQENPSLIAEIVKYSPLPEALGQKIAATMSKGPDPDVQAAQKAEKFAEINKTNSESEKNRALALQALSAAFVDPMLEQQQLQSLDGPFPVMPPGMAPPLPGLPPQQMMHPPGMPQPGMPPMGPGGPMGQPMRPPMLPGPPMPQQQQPSPVLPQRPPMPPGMMN